MMSKDSTLNWALKNNRLQDTRVVDKEWRKDKLPKIDIEVPSEEAPLPEGVGGQEALEEGICLREIDNIWRERLHEPHQEHSKQAQK